MLSALFGDKSSIKVKKCVGKTVVQLKSLTKQHIMKPDYPKDVLVAAVCKTRHVKEGYKWEAKSSITWYRKFLILK